MKELLILRHAKSSWKQPYTSDHERSLNKRGKRDAPRMGNFLRKEGMVPEMIITSSAVRARLTAEAVAENSEFEGEFVVTGQLYHGGTLEYLDVLQQLAGNHRRVMVVGHNPGMEELLTDLTGVYERMVTAAVALVILPIDSWRQLDESVQGKLEGIWRPKELDASRY